MTYNCPAYTVDTLKVVSCGKCGGSIIWQVSRVTGNKYPTDIKNNQTARNWFHNCGIRQPGLFQKQLSVTGIQTLFNAAAQHLKFPKIWLQTKSGQPLMIYRAGIRSKYNGQIMITNGEKFKREWFGRIDMQGVFHEQPGVTSEITDLLEQLSKDPAGTASAYGKLTGNCCFCYRKLEDKRSTDVGYGPVCADHYRLPWGVILGNKQLPIQAPPDLRTVFPGGENFKLERADGSRTGNWTITGDSKYTAELSDFGSDRRSMVCPDCGTLLQEQPLYPRKNGEGELTHYDGNCKCGAHITLFND